MNQIAYIELDTHAEIALSFMELMNDSKVFSVDYYFSEKILNNLGLNETENIKKATPENLFRQLSANNYQLIIIGTVHRYFNVFEKVTKHFKTSMICHNLNFVKVSNFDLLSSIFKEDVQYRLKLLFKEGLLRKSSVYQNANSLLVLDKTLTNENYKFLPVFFSLNDEVPKKSIVTIVIPGAVSQKRRDYEKVLKQIEKFTQNSHCQIVFLGKAQGKELEMLQNFEKSKPENISIKYFTEKVPQSEFDEYMKKADILWCPIQQETEFFSHKEIYGWTKMSGNIGDAIKYSKLAIFPKDYPSDYSFIIPEIENVEEQLFIHQKNMKYDFQENFSKEKVLEQLEKTIFALL